MNDVAPPTDPIIVRTIAPIPIADLKRKFSEDIQYVIDVDNSRIKNTALLTYLSNLNINVRLEFTDPSVKLDLLSAYFSCPMLLDIPDLEELAINVLLDASGNLFFLDFDPNDFIVDNYEIIETWLRRFNYMPLFALHCSGKYGDVLAGFPEDTNVSMAGINFVNLIKHELFPILVGDIKQEQFTWNKVFFNDYVFAGNNLFHYFADKNNPYFIGLLAIDDEKSFNELRDTLAAALRSQEELFEELANVSPM